MIDTCAPAWAILVPKMIVLLAGLGAAATGVRAAILWRDASLVPMPEYNPPLASIGDAPELHILQAVVDLNSVTAAIRLSGVMNARAARWTACAAIFSGVSALAGML